MQREIKDTGILNLVNNYSVLRSFLWVWIVFMRSRLSVCRITLRCWRHNWMSGVCVSGPRLALVCRQVHWKCPESKEQDRREPRRGMPAQLGPQGWGEHKWSECARLGKSSSRSRSQSLALKFSIAAEGRRGDVIKNITGSRKPQLDSESP